MKRLTALFVCAMAFICAWGQTGTWSLDSCVNYALLHNCDIQIRQAEVLKGRAELIQSELELLPSLNLYANQYFNWGRSVDMQELVIVRNRLTRQTSASAGASFLIFDGFARINTMEMHRHLLDAGKWNVRQQEMDVKADVSRAYLANILARLMHQRLGSSLENVRQQLERVRAENRLGTKSHSDCLELEAKMADIESRMVEARCEELSRLEELRSLLGCDVCFETDTSITEASFFRQTLAGEEFTPPGVLAAKSQVDAARHALRAAKGAILPSLSLNAAYGTYYSDASSEEFRSQFENNRNPSVSLSLTVPLFNGGRAAAAVAKASADLKVSRVKLQQAKQQAKSYYNQLMENCEVLSSQLQACSARCALSRERLQIASRQYELGAITTSQWIEASDNLSEAECDCLQTRCKYVFQLKLIEYYEDGCTW